MIVFETGVRFHQKDDYSGRLLKKYFNFLIMDGPMVIEILILKHKAGSMMADIAFWKDVGQFYV